MKRMILTAVAATALASPGVVAAAHHSEHQGRKAEHGVHHKRQHRHAHLLKFGSVASSTGAPGTGATAPSSTDPASPSALSGETAGTIASFSNGTLTITLTDGSTVSGKVTEGTEIECHAVMASAAGDDGQDQHGDGNVSGGEAGHDDHSNAGSDDGQPGDVSGQDESDDGVQGEAEHCTAAALVPGAVVREAELSVSSAGSIWQKVELAQ